MMFGPVIFIVSTVVASGVTCLRWRQVKKISWLTQRSFCESCQTPLKTWQLIPIFGFLMQRGHCSFCKASISKLSFFCEVAFSIESLILFYLLPLIQFSFWWIFLLWSLLLALDDYFTQTVSLLCLSFGLGFFIWYQLSTWALFERLPSAWLWLLPIAALLLFFVLIHWLGLADLLYLLLLMSLTTAFTVFLTIFLASSTALLVTLLSKQKTKDQFPFLPYLVFGFSLALLSSLIIADYLPTFWHFTY